jgi:hypothetical protein
VLLGSKIWTGSALKSPFRIASVGIDVNTEAVCRRSRYLSRHKKEHLVLPDGTAQREAALVLVVVRFDCREEGFRIECLVSKNSKPLPRNWFVPDLTT